MFQFVNSYFAYIYIAFFQKGWVGCIGKDMYGNIELSAQHSCVPDISTKLSMMLTVGIVKKVVKVKTSQNVF